MTSNLGSEKDVIGFNYGNIRKDDDIRNSLSTAFVNRINKVFYFNSLSYDDILKIVKNKINNLKKKYSKFNIKISVNSNEINKLIKESEYSIYGARRVNKLLEDTIDNIVINSLLKKTLNFK